MGLLTEGKPFDYKDSLAHHDYIKKHGIKQFLNVYNFYKDKKSDFFWGDEIEYILVQKDEEEKKIYLSLRAYDLLTPLREVERKWKKGESAIKPESLWAPEYGKFMIESTPYEPYDANFSKICFSVEDNMRKRRNHAKGVLGKGEIILSISMFPLMGAVKEFLQGGQKPRGRIANSLYSPDELINPHPRFGTLTRNIRIRRGENVCIYYPLYMDKNTDKNIGLHVPLQTTRDSDNQVVLTEELKKLHGKNINKGKIHMDAMSFGMGCCCLQVTYSPKDITLSRYLYDQYIPLAPIMLSVSVATPIVKGLLSDYESRWNIISGSVDDRTVQERKSILKSRYGSASMYLSETEESRKNSDLDIKFNKEAFKSLREGGIDAVLAKHISHLFIRDPLVIFDGFDKLSDNKSTDHFENLQSTNWQTVRFKAPPKVNGNINWRVEFRVLEIQLTDYENAAYSVFITLLTKAILHYRLKFYMPISKVDQNMDKAHKRDSVLNEKFLFRKNFYGKDKNEDAKLGFYTVNEILNGTKDFKGVIFFMKSYLDQQKLTKVERLKLDRYINLISLRASGKLWTAAKYLRHFVKNHKAYRNDSVVNGDIAFDLVKHMEDITNEKIKPQNLYN